MILNRSHVTLMSYTDFSAQHHFESNATKMWSVVRWHSGHIVQVIALK